MKAVTTAALAATLLATPVAAYADAEEEFLGTVETPAVTGAITVDVITYIPGEATGGAAASTPLGYVESDSVFAPVLVGDIWYVPTGWAG